MVSFLSGAAGRRSWFSTHFLFNKLFSNTKFQKWVSGFPILNYLAKREGEEIFDIIMGFVKSQVLLALVELQIMERLIEGPLSAKELSQNANLTEERMEILLSAGVALGLLKRFANGVKYGLSIRGASLMGVPGLAELILHHRHFYKDMQDPVSLLRDEVDTKLSKFWPYVLGEKEQMSDTVIENYSLLMEKTQKLVVEDTLKMIQLDEVQDLMDVGGGSGNFAIALAKKYKKLKITLLDLPEVAQMAEKRIFDAGLNSQINFLSRSFKEHSLPEGSDAISLIRVLYDHSDDTVKDILAKAYKALPSGGQLIISEPMTGGVRPNQSGDIYFAFYTMAMRTGKARSANQIENLCREAGFSKVIRRKPLRNFITSTLVSFK